MGTAALQHSLGEDSKYAKETYIPLLQQLDTTILSDKPASGRKRATIGYEMTVTISSRPARPGKTSASSGGGIGAMCMAPEVGGPPGMQAPAEQGCYYRI